MAHQAWAVAFSTLAVAYYVTAVLAEIPGTAERVANPSGNVLASQPSEENDWCPAPDTDIRLLQVGVNVHGFSSVSSSASSARKAATASSCNGACDLFISQYRSVAGNPSNNYLQLFNPTQAEIDLSDYVIVSCSDGCESDSTLFETSTALYGTLAAGSTFTICTIINSWMGSGCDLSVFTSQLAYNGDDTVALAKSTSHLLTTLADVVDVVGQISNVRPSPAWAVCGSGTWTTANVLLTRAADQCCGSGSDDTEFDGSVPASCSWTADACDSCYGIQPYAGTCSCTETSPSRSPSARTPNGGVIAGAVLAGVLGFTLILALALGLTR